MNDDYLEIEKAILNDRIKKIKKNYEIIRQKDDEEAKLILDTVEATRGIEAILEVYARDGYIHPGYAVEKLDHSIDRLQWLKNYYEEKENEGRKCCLCGEKIGGYGNNAQPLKDGRCCDKCNVEKVIPARISGEINYE